MTDSERPQRRLKPPPNYRSRAMQLRLFTVVVIAMGVLYLVTEAAKPSTWHWLAGGEQEAPATKPGVEQHVDTHLEELPSEVAPSSVPGAVVIADPFRSSLEVADAGEDGLSRALADGWGAFYQSLSGDERLLLAKAFHRAGEHKALDEADGPPWRELLAKGDRFWSGYRENAAKGLAQDGNQLAPEEMTAWLQVLGKVGESWIRDREVLESLASTTPTEVTATRDERLQRLEQRWQRLSLAAIKDDTVHRPAETDAWFWLLNILKETPQAQLDRQGTSVGFVQLFKQPKDYRGKLITMSGRVHQAKRVKAAKNPYGIDFYYILWIQPHDGPQSPIVVYALELPSGFPALDQPNLEGGYTRLRENVDITGYFFKRWAYRAHNGINTAPLLLAKAPRWYPAVNIGEKSTELPSGWVFASWVLGAALFGTVVAALVYIRTRDSSIAVETLNSSPLGQQELQRSLANAEAGPSVQESLQELEKQHRQQGTERSS